MELQQAIDKAIKLSKERDTSYNVILIAALNGGEYTYKVVTPEFCDTDEFEAFDGRIIESYFAGEPE